MTAKEGAAYQKNLKNNMRIFCIACNDDVEARLTDGREIYPHRLDLHNIPFWKCDNCKNYVGCHHKSTEQTKPLGCIATPEIFKLRQEIHYFLDPIWKSKRISRGKVYANLSIVLERLYHTGELRSVDEANRVLTAVKDLHHSILLSKSYLNPELYFPKIINHEETN